MVTDNLRIRAMEIETNTHCNFKCKFCPNHTDPKTPQIIDMGLFNEILDKSLEFGKIKIISISSYSEPTLNPKFEEIVTTIAKKTPYELTLYTNGANLTNARIDLLKELGNTRCIIFGIPSLNKDNHKKVTLADGLARSREAMDYAIAKGVVSIVSIPGTINELVLALPEFYEKYYRQLNGDRKYAMPMRGDRLEALPQPIETITDRCGTVKDTKYKKFIKIDEERLYGCNVPEEWIYFDVSGNMFLCCEDFFRESTYGNIKDGTIEEILNSKKSVELRGCVSGKRKAPKNFICRRCINMKYNISRVLDIKDYKLRDVR